MQKTSKNGASFVDYGFELHKIVAIGEFYAKKEINFPLVVDWCNRAVPFPGLDRHLRLD